MKSLIGLIFIPALITAQEQYEIDLPAQQEQFLRQPEPIKAPTAEQVKARFSQWLKERSKDADQKDVAWQSGKSTSQNLFEAFSSTHKDVKALADSMQSRETGEVLKGIQSLLKKEAGPFLATNVGFEAARYLTRVQHYDEASGVYADLEVDESVDPAAFLFFRAISEFGLLHKDDAIDTLTRIVQDIEGGPERYKAVAEILLLDLQYLDEDGLEHLARSMDDVKRRLSLDRVGEKVKEEQKEIIARLDKMIDKIENQSGGGGGGGGGSGSKPGPGGQGAPAADSSVLRGKGAGRVDNKSLKGASAWGNLPEKERARMLQALGRDFPDHYKNAIQEYFRKLAAEENAP